MASSYTPTTDFVSISGTNIDFPMRPSTHRPRPICHHGSCGKNMLSGYIVWQTRACGPNNVMRGNKVSKKSVWILSQHIYFDVRLVIQRSIIYGILDAKNTEEEAYVGNKERWCSHMLNTSHQTAGMRNEKAKACVVSNVIALAPAYCKYDQPPPAFRFGMTHELNTETRWMEKILSKISAMRSKAL